MDVVVDCGGVVRQCDRGREVIAYYVPWADNLLDTIASPAAVVAGIVASASVLGEVPPALQWTFAAIAGGGVAGVVQAATVLLRGTSTATTGGLGNSVVSTTELILAVGVAVLALLAPFVALALLVIAGRRLEVHPGVAARLALGMRGPQHGDWQHPRNRALRRAS